MDDRALIWTVEDSRTLLTTPVFTLRENDSVSPEGIRGKYVVADAKDWAVVVPVHDGNFVLVRQWRHGAGCVTTEFPGGVVERGEDPAAAAARELEEETAYRAGKLTKLGEMNPNPALFSNRLHIYLAEELTSVGAQRLDADELIHCREVPIAEVIRDFGTGAYQHAYMGTALGLYLREQMK